MSGTIGHVWPNLSFRVRGFVRAGAGCCDRACRRGAARPPDLCAPARRARERQRAPALHGGGHPLQPAPGRGGRRPGARRAARPRQRAHGDLERPEAGFHRSAARSRRRGGRDRHHRRRRADRRRAGGSLSVSRDGHRAGGLERAAERRAHRGADQGLRRLPARGDAHADPDAEHARAAAAGGGRLHAGAGGRSQTSARHAHRQRAGRRPARARRRSLDAGRRRRDDPRRQLRRAPDFASSRSATPPGGRSSRSGSRRWRSTSPCVRR